MKFSARAIVNLLRSSEYLPLAENPSRVREIVAEGRADASTDPPVVVIDEIQKLPVLLDEVHDLIETEKMHFVLSGSSGRKLKRSGVNLLGGRAWQANLFPLTSAEIPEFNLRLPDMVRSPGPPVASKMRQQPRFLGTFCSFLWFPT